MNELPKVCQPCGAFMYFLLSYFLFCSCYFLYFASWIWGDNNHVTLMLLPIVCAILVMRVLFKICPVTSEAQVKEHKSAWEEGRKFSSK